MTSQHEVTTAPGGKLKAETLSHLHCRCPRLWLLPTDCWDRDTRHQSRLQGEGGRGGGERGRSSCGWHMQVTDYHAEEQHNVGEGARSSTGEE